MDLSLSDRKILLVSYHFPPSVEVGGRRPSGLKKYLERRGWEVHVVTEDPAKYPPGSVPAAANISRHDGGGGTNGPLRKAMRSLKASIPGKSRIRETLNLLLDVPDAHVGWALRAIMEARRRLKQERIPIVYTTAPPHSANLVGLVLKRLDPGLLWVCEFRDLWTSDVGYRYKDNPFRRRADAYIERELLTRADRIVTVTEAFLRILLERYKADMQVVYNGFDRDFYPALTARERNEVFRVLYCGSLYTGERDPQPFLSALEDCVVRGDIHPDRIRVEFFVQRYDRDSLEKAKRTMRYPQILVIRDTVPYEKIARIQGEVECHLVINRNHQCEIGPIPAKIYEFIATGLPILVWDPANSMKEDLCYLGRYRGLSIHTGPGSLKTALVDLYRAWLEGGNTVHTESDDFSQEIMAGKVEAILEELLEKRRCFLRETTGR